MGQRREDASEGYRTVSPTPMSLAQSLEIACCTDPGIVRSHNEDSIVSDASIGLVVLADGMGGYNAGEVASGMTTSVIATEMLQVLVATQFFVVVCILDVDEPFGQRDVTGDRMLTDRQFKILEGMEAGFQARNDRHLVITDGIKRKTIGAEDGQQIAAHRVEHFLEFSRRCDLVQDKLQVLAKHKLRPRLGNRSGLAVYNRTHSPNLSPGINATESIQRRIRGFWLD